MEKKDLTREWIPYDQDYCKAMQDAKLIDGTILIMCWPNAGVWESLYKEDPNYGKVYSNLEVAFVRKTDPILTGGY